MKAFFVFTLAMLLVLVRAPDPPPDSNDPVAKSEEDVPPANRDEPSPTDEESPLDWFIREASKMKYSNFSRSVEEFAKSFEALLNSSDLTAWTMPMWEEWKKVKLFELKALDWIWNLVSEPEEPEKIDEQQGFTSFVRTNSTSFSDVVLEVAKKFGEAFLKDFGLFELESSPPTIEELAKKQEKDKRSRLLQKALMSWLLRRKYTVRKFQEPDEPQDQSRATSSEAPEKRPLLQRLLKKAFDWVLGLVSSGKLEEPDEPQDQARTSSEADKANRGRRDLRHDDDSSPEEEMGPSGKEGINYFRVFKEKVQVTYAPVEYKGKMYEVKSKEWYDMMYRRLLERTAERRINHSRMMRMRTTTPGTAGTTQSSPEGTTPEFQAPVRVERHLPDSTINKESPPIVAEEVDEPRRRQERADADEAAVDYSVETTTTQAEGEDKFQCPGYEGGKKLLEVETTLSVEEIKDLVGGDQLFVHSYAPLLKGTVYEKAPDNHLRVNVSDWKIRTPEVKTRTLTYTKKTDSVLVPYSDVTEKESLRENNDGFRLSKTVSNAGITFGDAFHLKLESCLNSIGNGKSLLVVNSLVNITGDDILLPFVSPMIHSDSNEGLGQYYGGLEAVIRKLETDEVARATHKERIISRTTSKGFEMDADSDDMTTAQKTSPNTIILITVGAALLVLSGLLMYKHRKYFLSKPVARSTEESGKMLETV